MDDGKEIRSIEILHTWNNENSRGVVALGEDLLVATAVVEVS
jgi:hypothetical protein